MNSLNTNKRQSNKCMLTTTSD